MSALAVVADREPVIAAEPGDGAFDDPAVPPEMYQRLATRMETRNVERLALLNPAALNGLSPAEYAKKVVAERMKGKAALHEPDIIGGGADVIRLDPNGLPRLGDLGVNSSIGAQWSGRNHAAIKRYAEDL